MLIFSIYIRKINKDIEDKKNIIKEHNKCQWKISGLQRNSTILVKKVLINIKQEIIIIINNNNNKIIK